MIMKKKNEELKTVEELNQEIINDMLDAGYTEVDPNEYKINSKALSNKAIYDSSYMRYSYLVNVSDWTDEDKYFTKYECKYITKNIVEIEFREIYSSDIKEVTTGLFKPRKFISNKSDTFLIDNITKIFFKESNINIKSMFSSRDEHFTTMSDKILKQIKIK